MPKSKPSKCKFLKTWLDTDIHPGFGCWLREVPTDVYSAMCILCKTTFALSSMGIGAVTSHEKESKHSAAIKNLQKIPDIAGFLKKKAPDTTTIEVVRSSTSNASCSLLSPEANVPCPSSSTSLVTSLVPDPAAPALPPAATTSSFAPTTPRAQGQKYFLQVDEITTAEILMTLQSVMSKQSPRDLGNLVRLLPSILPDSEIAKKINLQKDKACYIVSHGLGPYFEQQVKTQLQKQKYFVAGFDESFNKVAQKEQMDIVVRYWDDDKAEVIGRFLTSVFLGHTTAEDLLQAFTSALSDFKLNRLLQVSMDGPAVNFKFLRELKLCLSEANPEAPILLDIGSCGLHTGHGAFKAGIASTGWNIECFLRSLFNLFKNVPARRANYVRITGSDLFPKKFCAIRWIENTGDAERAIQMLPHLKVFVKKNTIDSQSFRVVEKSIADGTLGVKLAFFYSLAADVEPFLTTFQREAPMAPFLYEALNDLLFILLEKNVKSEVLNKAKEENSLSTVDVRKSENLIFAKNIDVGFSTRQAIAKCTSVSEKDILVLKQTIRTCLSEVIRKIQFKSPLKYPLTKALSCLTPRVVLIENVREERVKLALEILLEKKWITGVQAGRCKRALKKVCQSDDTQALLKSFDEKTERLDHLWMRILKMNPDEVNDLTDFVKILLLLSHGNAALERGFSVNSNLLVENLGERSLIAQRQVHDFVQCCGGIKEVAITKSMIHYVRNEHSRYKEALEEKRSQDAEKAKQNAEKIKRAKEISELLKKKVDVLENAKHEARAIDAQVEALKSVR